MPRRESDFSFFVENDMMENKEVVVKSVKSNIEFSKHSLDFMLLNVRSLLNKKDIVEVTAMSQFFDVIILNEVRVELHGKLPNWPDYQVVSDVREHGNGGVAVYCHCSIIVKRLDFQPHGKYECVWLVLGEGDKQFSLVAPYIRPGLSEEDRDEIFWDLMEKSQKCRDLNMSILLAGDLNAHIGKDNKGIENNPVEEIRENGAMLRNMVDIFQAEICNKSTLSVRTCWTN
jgi:hypothetical protein